MFDVEKVKLTPAQLELADVVYSIQGLIRAELEDEDPGEIDWDDIITIALQFPSIVPKINRLIAMIGQTDGALELGTLFAGAGAGTLNHIIADLAESKPEE